MNKQSNAEDFSSEDRREKARQAGLKAAQKTKENVTEQVPAVDWSPIADLVARKFDKEFRVNGPTREALSLFSKLVELSFPIDPNFLAEFQVVIKQGIQLFLEGLADGRISLIETVNEWRHLSKFLFQVDVVYQRKMLEKDPLFRTPLCSSKEWTAKRDSAFKYAKALAENNGIDDAYQNAESLIKSLDHFANKTLQFEVSGQPHGTPCALMSYRPSTGLPSS